MSARPLFRVTTRRDGETVEHIGATLAEATAAASLDRREGRIAAIASVAEALLAGEQPTRADALFVGSALSAWLTTDRGKLERDFFRVLRPRSHATVARIWRALQNSVKNRPPSRVP